MPEMIPIDLFSYAYIPAWYEQLFELSQLAAPEPWQFKQPTYETQNDQTPIFERYINQIFKKQLVEYNCFHPEDADSICYLHNEFSCLHTGLYAADLRLLEYQEADKASKPAEKVIRWVERQANSVGIAAMFLRSVIAAIIKKHWKDVADTQDNLGHKMALIISRIVKDKQKAKSIIMTRMICMRSIGAKGALNYVDGHYHYIADFAFDEDNISPRETFTISRSQFTDMYEKNTDFRKLISTHAFVYADGHVCINQPHIVHKTEKGFLLTNWALGHIDECCLKFTKTYRVSAQHYRVGELHADQDYNESYLMIHSFEITGMTMEELMDKNLEYLDELPRRPSKALIKLIKDRVKTQRGLAAASGLSEAKISRMCNDDNYAYSIQDVTRIVIGLQLPPPLSALFLDMTGFTRAVMVKYLKYQCIMDCLFMEDIEDVVETHKKLFDKQ